MVHLVVGAATEVVEQDSVDGDIFQRNIQRFDGVECVARQLKTQLCRMLLARLPVDDVEDGGCVRVGEVGARPDLDIIQHEEEVGVNGLPLGTRRSKVVF